MVLSEVYYPSWKAYVDGYPTHLYVADGALRAVAVPPGDHIVNCASSLTRWPWHSHHVLGCPAAEEEAFGIRGLPVVSILRLKVAAASSGAIFQPSNINYQPIPISQSPSANPQPPTNL